MGLNDLHRLDCSGRECLAISGSAVFGMFDMLDACVDCRSVPLGQRSAVWLGRQTDVSSDNTAG